MPRKPTLLPGPPTTVNPPPPPPGTPACGSPPAPSAARFDPASAGESAALELVVWVAEQYGHERVLDHVRAAWYRVLVAGGQSPAEAAARAGLPEPRRG